MTNITGVPISPSTDINTEFEKYCNSCYPELGYINCKLGHYCKDAFTAGYELAQERIAET